MNKGSKLYKIIVSMLLMLSFSCKDRLVELNENPNAVAPNSANPNLMLAPVLSQAAKGYLRLGFGTVGGVMQHMQEDGWFAGYNHYQWAPENWGGWYGPLRTNELILRRAEELGWPFHAGIGLTMRAFLFGVITDLWGDAPYTEALKAGSADAITHPKYDSQEVIYLGIIEDLKAAANIFAQRNTNGIIAEYDLFYGGDAEKWHRFANSLLLRYYMRISEKLPEVARQGIESVYQTGIYIQDAADDATHDFLGTDRDNSWPTAGGFTSDDTDFRRRKPCSTLLDIMLANNDPRVPVWFQPVYCRWVADPSLTVPVDPYIRRNGVLTNIVSLTDVQYRQEIANGNTFTRHFNPNTFTTAVLDTREYVGIPPGLNAPDTYNYNPTPGQTVENQHVSQLAPIFRERTGGVLTMRLMSAAETAFILSEAAFKGWSVGDAETHYNNGVLESLKAWEADNTYDAFIAQPGVAYDGTLARIMEQKWIASFAAATESWFDYRRTGLPNLTPGQAAQERYMPLRFIYGENELNNNTANLQEALGRLEPLSQDRGANSQWSKPWIVQGTGKPW